MARQRFYHDPARKHIEAYQDFSGGLNTTSSNDNVQDNELVKLQNVDLGDRGSLKRRKGFRSEKIFGVSGKAQGIFRYHRTYAPYNLLGLEGTFDGTKKSSGKDVSIGGWYAFNMPNEEDVYKVNRDDAKELIVNGDFENGTTGWHLDIKAMDVGDSLVGRSVNALSGQNVLRIRSFKNHSGYLNEYQSGKHEVSVVPGDLIRAETMVRRAAVSIGAVPYRAHLVLSVKKKDGTRERFYFSEHNVNTTWKKITASMAMPKDAVSVLIGVGIVDRDTSQNTAAYFDNVKMFKGGSSTNLVKNSNFEQGDKDWVLNVDDLTAGDSLVGKSVSAYTGENVLRIRRYKGHGGHYNEYQKFDKEVKVKQGENIYAEVMYRAAAKVIGEAPYRVHLIASVKKKNGSRERMYINKYDADLTWKKLSGTFKMPKDAVSVVFGVGIIDNASHYDVAAYFDAFYARKIITGSQNSVVAIRSSAADEKVNRGVGYRFPGMEEHKYYIYVTDYKQEGANVKGAIAVRDERYGVYPNDYALVQRKEFTAPVGQWTTQYMKFKTGPGVDQARAYVYNYSDLGVIGTVYYDNARIYEITAEMYHQLDEMTIDEIEEQFPFRLGQLMAESISETIMAIGGKFYVNGIETPVEGSANVQTERTIEAVSFQNNLYIASGSGLLVYNGSTIAEISPYDPDPLETLYIGSNGLLTNPYDISDKEQPVVELKALRFSRRYGVTNQEITLSVGVGKPGAKALEFKYERRNVRDKENYWFKLKDWAEDNFVTFKTSVAGEYQFRVSVREKGKKDDEVLDDYFIPKYIIKPTEDDSDRPIDGNTIDMCNKIILHWDRLITYGDPTKPDVIYISDLQRPNYFPVNNTLKFENPRRESITTILKYRDSLAVFTPSSIQALHGTNPENYERYMLNTDTGCIAPRTARVVQNNIIFLSYEGITVLKSVGTSETKSNVHLLDDKIKSLVEFESDAVSYVRNNQYVIVYPQSKRQLRYYYDWDVWTLDESHSLDFVDAIIEDAKMHGLGADGRYILDDDMSYADDGEAFETIVSTKLYNFGETYAEKKTRELQVMFDPLEGDTKIDVATFIDKPYYGDRAIQALDFKYDIKQHEQEYYVTEITPSHANTLKKGLAHDVYDPTAPREGISNFAHRKDAVMAFSASGGLSADGLQGLQVYNGEVLRLRNKGQRLYETLAYMDDGTLKIIDDYSDTKDPDLSGVKHTWHFGPYLIKDGVARTTFPDFNDHNYLVEQKHPRQAVGMKADGTILIITVDGRSDVAPGMDLYELTRLFQEHGCIVAYNLDGGGSAQSFVDGKPLNVYSDGKERNRRDFIYLTKDAVEIIEGDKSGLVSSVNIDLNQRQDIYKIPIPGKGINVGTTLTHKENRPIKFVGMSYTFKLKKP